MNSEENNKPTVPVYQYPSRHSRTGLARRLGFNSVEEVSKNRNKIVNEQRRKLEDMKQFQRTPFNQKSQQGFSNNNNNNRRRGQGKNLVNRKISIDRSWKVNPKVGRKNRDIKKRKEQPKPKSLDDLDKEMESYFNPQPVQEQKPQVEEKSAEQLNQELDNYMSQQ